MDATTWIAIIAAVFGGAGLKVIEKWLNRGVYKEDIATKLRAELRLDIERHRKHADEAEAEADKWRDRYYKLLEERELHDAVDEPL